MEGQVDPHYGTRVGALLCSTRLRAGIDLQQMARCLHIRQTFLEAIESGRFEALPGPVYTVGFVRAYAEQLGLDPDEIVRRLKSEIADLDAEPPLNFPAPLSEGGTPKAAVLLLGGLIALLAYGTWYATSSRDAAVTQLVAPVPERLDSRPAGGDKAGVPLPPASPSPPPGALIAGRDQPPTAAPGAVGPLPIPSRPTATAEPPAIPVPPAPPSTTFAAEPVVPAPPPAPPTPTPTHASGGTSVAMAAEHAEEVATSAADAGARIVLRAKADSWIEVRDPQSNSLVTARLLRAGDSYAVPDRPGLKLLTGNAGGLAVVVDGDPLPALGRDGVVRRGISLEPEALRSGTFVD